MGSAGCLGHGSRGSWFSLSLIVLALLVGGKKKRQLLWRCIANVFWQTKQQIPFCWSLPISCPPFGISCLPCLYSQLQGQSCLQQSLSLIYLNFPGMSIQGQHLSWCLNICLSPSIWSSFHGLYSLLELYLQSVIMNSCPNPLYIMFFIVLIGLLQFDVYSALFSEVLSLTFHLWGKCLQPLCWYILSFVLEKFFMFCCGWVMSDVWNGTWSGLRDEECVPFSSCSTILQAHGGLSMQLFWTFWTQSLWSNSQNKL